MKFGAALVAAVSILVPMVATRADQDTAWIARTLHAAGGSSSTADRQISVSKRSVVSISGLARADSEDQPKRKVDVVCIPGQLQTVLDDIASKFGPVSITSTCRSASANAAAGGAPKSYHLIGQAVDFRVAGAGNAILAFLAAHDGVGGLQTHGDGLYHIDTGPKRRF